MNHALKHPPRRPAKQSAAVAHTAKDAAIHLVRLEFERARLKSDILHAQQRIARFEMDLRRTETECERLLAVLHR